MTLQTDLQEAIKRVQTDSQILRNIIQGNAQSTVLTENGDVKTVAKTIKDIEDNINEHITDFTEAVDDAESFRDQAEQYAQNAEGFVNALNLPTDLTGKAGMLLIIKDDETGYEPIDPSSLLPIGISIEWNGNTPPDNFLEENGAEISRETYADLFAVIGTIFGTGDNSTTFNLPDSRRRVAVGSGGTATHSVVGTNIGNTGGLEAHILQAEQIPTHAHSGSSLSTNAAGNHTHNHYNGGNYSIGGTNNIPKVTVGAYGVTTQTYGNTAGITTAGNHTHTISGNTGSYGSGWAHNNMQPSIVKMKCIKYR